MAILILMLGSTVEAQKFGYINSALLLNDMPEMKQLRSTLDGFKTQLQKQGESRLTAYKAKEQNAVQKKQRGEMTPKEEETTMKDLQKEQEELYSMSQEFDQKLSEKQQELMAPILERVNKAIQEVAKEGGFQYIFDAQAGIILYADESTNVTPIVKTKLGI